MFQLKRAIAILPVLGHEERAISLILACCSKSSSFDGHSHTLSDASTEFRVNLVEMLELSFFCSAVTCTKVASNVIHSALSHSFIEDLVEECARLLVVVVWMNVGVSSNWSICWLCVDGVLFIFFGSCHLSWLVVWSLSITVRIHHSVALVVCRSESCSIWAVNWDLVVVGSETMSVGVSVVDKSSLQHFVVRCLNSWNEVSWSKC